jgi:release factor glutamine methyltransferase
VSATPPRTVGWLLDQTTTYFKQKGCESPRLDAQVLLAHVLKCGRIHLYTRFEETPPDDVVGQFRELVRRRVQGCPVAYLVGVQEFYLLAFEVTPAVLIPRPDTETLIVEALKLLKGLEAPDVIDVGTGSGCIAVTVAHQHKAAKVTATDVSDDALAVASRNAAKHGLSDRIRFRQGDLFAAAGERFDVVLSNPPYVAAEEMAGLPVGVRDFEPHLALNGGPGGFAVFQRLIEQARGHLKPGGHLLVEIGSDQEGPARERIAAAGGYSLAPTVHDRAGQPRVLHARLAE